MRETMKFYLAGLFDGEGYIGITRMVSQKGYIGYCLYAGVNMVDKEPPELFHKYFGGSLNLRQAYKDPATRPTWRWQVESKKAYEFITILQPCLRVKKQKAKLAIAYQQMKKHYNYKPVKERDAEINAYWEMKKLNRRGIHALSA